MGGSPNDIRISDMRPTLVEPPMYKPKVVLLGKDKKGIVVIVWMYSEMETQRGSYVWTNIQFTE